MVTVSFISGSGGVGGGSVVSQDWDAVIMKIPKRISFANFVILVECRKLKVERIDCDFSKLITASAS
jgi:hypothetical protein